MSEDCSCGCKDDEPYEETDEECKNRADELWDDACVCHPCPCCG